MPICDPACQRAKLLRRMNIERYALSSPVTFSTGRTNNNERRYHRLTTGRGPVSPHPSYRPSLSGYAAAARRNAVVIPKNPPANTEPEIPTTEDLPVTETNPVNPEYFYKDVTQTLNPIDLFNAALSDAERFKIASLYAYDANGNYIGWKNWMNQNGFANNIPAMLPYANNYLGGTNGYIPQPIQSPQTTSTTDRTYYQKNPDGSMIQINQLPQGVTASPMMQSGGKLNYFNYLWNNYGSI